MMQIPLYGRDQQVVDYVLVDDADFPWLNCYRWSRQKPKRNCTAYRTAAKKHFGEFANAG